MSYTFPYTRLAFALGLLFLTVFSWAAPEQPKPEPIAAPKEEERAPVSIVGLYWVKENDMTVRIWSAGDGYRVQWDRPNAMPAQGIGHWDRAGRFVVGFSTPTSTTGRVAPGVAWYKVTLEDGAARLTGQYMETDGKEVKETLVWLPRK